jgi:hypothetical protein
LTYKYLRSYRAKTMRIQYVLVICFLLALSLHVSAINATTADSVSMVHFSVPHGFYYGPFTVSLSTNITGSKILYTTDGSDPSTDNGKEFNAPVQITTTTVLRAVTSMNSVYGTVSTSSYFFPEDIMHQTNTPEGYPALWGSYTDISGTAVADYEMDPEIVNDPDYSALIIPSLLLLPSLSIVTEKGNLFSHSNQPETGGIYIFTGANGGTGDNWERPASAEYIVPGTTEGFQVNCGLQIQGGASRLAEKNPKHSFRLAFRNQYGPDKLRYPLFGKEAVDKFNGIVLRASFGNTWRHWDPAQRNRATHIQDVWAKDTQLSMGYVSAHSKFVHLFLNGIYWGVYNFSERLDNDFMESYLGGDKENWDILKDYNELMDGNADAWNYLWTAVNGNISDNAVYQKLIGNNPDGSRNPDYPAYIDPENLCDYMLINFYGGNNDWDHHNWVAGRDRVYPGKGFMFFCWDTEKIFENVNENYVNENNAQRPSGIFRKLLTNKEFKLLFADRVNFRLCNDGILTPGPVIAQWLTRADEIDTAMIAESARWGDYRRDVHPWNAGPYTLYTFKDFWLPEKTRLLNSYFPARTQTVLNQLATANLLPTIPAPVFSQSGGNVPEGFRLKITTTQGTIYYTLDGTDPRKTGGSISPAALIYSSPQEISQLTEVKARVKAGDSWSALTMATFISSGIQSEEKIIVVENRITGFPNPFKEEVCIKYSLQNAGNVVFTIYRTDGILVSRETNGYQSRGDHTWIWRPDNPEQAVYILQLNCGKYQAVHRLIHIK